MAAVFDKTTRIVRRTPDPCTDHQLAVRGNLSWNSITAQNPLGLIPVGTETAGGVEVALLHGDQRTEIQAWKAGPGGFHVIHVTGNRIDDVDGDYWLDVYGNSTVNVYGNYSETINGTDHRVRGDWSTEFKHKNVQKIIGGANVAIFLGFDFKLNVAVTVALAATIDFKIGLSASFSLDLFKCGLTLFDLKLATKKEDFSLGRFTASSWTNTFATQKNTVAVTAVKAAADMVLGPSLGPNNVI